MTASSPAKRPATPELAQLIDAAARCQHGVAQGRSLSDLLAGVAAPLRPGVQALVFHSLRQAGLTAAVVRLLASRAPAPAVRALLQVTLALMPPVCVAPGDPRYDAHTLVNQAVQACKGGRETRAQAGFVNACLRRFLREADALMASARQDPVALWNHPAWWIRRLQDEHPAQWQTILERNNRPGAMDLRVNRRRCARDAYLEQLRTRGMDARPFGADGVRLAQPVSVELLPGFDLGWVSVQDGAAQWAAEGVLGGLGLPAGARVLDACAAPGGKTAHLLERADLRLWALDQDARRCQRIRDNLARLGLQAHVMHADAAAVDVWWDGIAFDAVLLDAPCTASGIVRRHPDVRWLRREADVSQLAAQQRRLLDALWPLVRPGGRLLYATCSVFRAEGADQVKAFLERHTDARAGPAPGHLLPGTGDGSGMFNDNDSGEHDGFFYARLEKTAA